LLAVIPFEDEEEAVAIGNDVAYGLAGAFGAFFHRRGLERDPLT
jgi:acyl-CoA reductase-like NAD-dependent aldehyde dehydrogenase